MVLVLNVCFISYFTLIFLLTSSASYLLFFCQYKFSPFQLWLVGDLGKGGKGANTKASIAKEPQALELKIEQGGYALTLNMVLFSITWS